MSSTPAASGLAFKAYEIEELADVYFFRPLGMVFARLARAAGLTPIAVTLIGSAIGVAGGALLYWPSAALLGFGLIILHSVLDSSDGQLARMTGQVSELGRVLDGAGGYVTHVAIYIAILASALQGGAGRDVLLLAFVAALSNVLHAQMYDYHRGTYSAIAIKAVPSLTAAPRSGILGAYERLERALAGRHPAVEAAIAARASGGRVRDDDRRRYRECFYGPVRGWNLLGDNTRFYAIGLLALLGRLHWFFMVIAVPMNAALALLHLWQARADRRFLIGL